MISLEQNKDDRNRSLEIARQIACRVDHCGGSSYFVGGYVRDELLGIANTDIDMEVHGVTLEQLSAILDDFGEKNELGAGFGIFSMKDFDIDVALPRTERAIGKGHKDFEVTVDPFLGTKNAAIRRDFTINALMKNVLTGEIVDHFSGLDDLEHKRIRHVDGASFVEDPLRLFRGAQFAARFKFQIAPETIELCRGMDTTTLPGERVFGEMKKALLQAEKPSGFFWQLRSMGQLSVWFPELERLIGLLQNPRYHKEGDVWIHTMMVLDEAAKRRDLVNVPLAFMLSALTHDFGKATTTEIVKGEIHCYGHETAGMPLAEQFLKRLRVDRQTQEYVLNMIHFHMRPHSMAAARSKIKKTNQMFDQSVEPFDLIQLATSDARSTMHDGPFIDHESFLMERLAVYHKYMERPYVMGRDLVEAGLKPGKDFKEILAYAHKLRLAGVKKDNALRQTLMYARNHCE